MNKLKVLICDDEALALQRLSSLFTMIDGVETSAVADSTEIMGTVQAFKPDLLLLDIEMPEVDGFDIVDQLGHLNSDDTPLIAFVTAHRQFAPQAFDSGAIDFIPKPARLSRLELTVERARRALAGREAARRLVEIQHSLEILRESSVATQEPHVWVAQRGEMVRIELRHVDRVAAEGAYVRLHVGENSYLHRAALAAIYAQMNKQIFVRVHRSHVVRVDFAKSMKRKLHGRTEITSSDGCRIPMGRKYATEARRKLLHDDLSSV